LAFLPVAGKEAGTSLACPRAYKFRVLSLQFAPQAANFDNSHLVITCGLPVKRSIPVDILADHDPREMLLHVHIANRAV